ncbi:YjfB family protein [Yokenella regensburgei]|uniref:YjfB family protein n=1 Tax=Yokenella regensburgei TaxID=158877 RepID=UPI003F14BA0B
MDSSQIVSLSTSLNSYQLNSQVSTLVLRKALDAQESAAVDLINQIPQLPSNPAIGRNINTTA